MTATAPITDLIVYELHPHVAWLREIAGYQDDSSGYASSSASEDENEEQKDAYLKHLDPKEWKDQDHYAVLGLRKLRFKATEAQLRKAYRAKVLAHHPDKKSEEGDENNDYFACVTKAYEILGNSDSRRSYDSVDPHFDDSVPSIEEGQTDFYGVFGPVFLANSRWSRKHPVPLLSTDHTDFAQVEVFYNFWYNFDSWREFSYLDEEDKAKGDCREEKRYIDKQNKVERLRRRKEEVRRIRLLVDNAHACDPRIIRHNQEEREKREAKIQAKAEEKKKKEEEYRTRIREEAERVERERVEEEQRRRAEQEAAKKEKEAAKTRMKKEKRVFRQAMAEWDYFAIDALMRIRNMGYVEAICHKLTQEEFEALNAKMKGVSKEVAETIFNEQVSQVISTEIPKEVKPMGATAAVANGDDSKGLDSRWTHDVNQCLIKALKTIPAGTVKRWDAIADYINMHVREANFTGKEVLKRTKVLQTNDQAQRKEANSQAFDVFTNQVAQSDALKDVKATDRCEVAEAPRPWTYDEQKLLEEALRHFPPGDPQRWDKISDTVRTRSRKECMLRYKELVQKNKDKKATAAPKQ